MIGSMRVESVSLPVSDQGKVKSFYVDALGFELLVDDKWREGMRWSEVAPRVPRPLRKPFDALGTCCSWCPGCANWDHLRTSARERGVRSS